MTTLSRCILVPGGIVAALALVVTASVWASGATQQASCEGARVVVEGGQPPLFVLPDNAGATLEVDPDAILRIRVENPPPNPQLRWRVGGLPGDLASGQRDLGRGPGEVDVRQVSEHIRGLYEINGTLLSGAREVCSLDFKVRITGFGGTAAIASTAAAGVAGLGALASAAYTARGARLKVQLKVQLQRRRPRGWRRWVPVPAWKPTIIGTITGAMTGFLATVALQQGGLTVYSVATAVRGIIIGGGVTFGVGISWGAVWTFLRPPPKEPT